MRIDEITPLRYVLDLNERLDEGCEVPAGECKQCKSLVFVVKKFDIALLAARFAQLLMAIKDLNDITWSDVATEAQLKPEQVLEFMKAAKTLWGKVEWIYNNQGVENVLTGKKGTK